PRPSVPASRSSGSEWPRSNTTSSDDSGARRYCDERPGAEPSAPGRDRGSMQTVGNILWLIFVGLWLAIGFVVAGIFMFILIITIPFGIQAFKMAGFALWPFGRHVEYGARVTSPLHIIGNIIWIIDRKSTRLNS